MTTKKFLLFMLIQVFISFHFLYSNNYDSIGDSFTINGILIDDISKETLIGANIYDETNQVGVVTNEFGFYSITLPKGTVKLKFSYVGYSSVEKVIELTNDIRIDVSLNNNKELAEVVVYGDNGETGITSTNMGAIDIPVALIKRTPTLLGESDVMKTIQTLPGVQAGTEGSAGIYVRGGGADENLILLDGVPLYNVDHLYGFFSTFTADAIKKVSFFKSSFPARFGGRLSSVIDVRTNDGDMEKYHGTIGIGLLASKFQFEGPIIKGKTSFNIAARRSYIDLLTKPFMDKNDKLSYYFYDINAKINHKFSDKSRLYVSFYNGKDKMSSTFKESSQDFASNEGINLGWGNLMSSVRWNYVISPKLFSNMTFAYTQYRMKVNTKISEKDYIQNMSDKYSSEYKSGINDFSYNLNFDYYPKPKHHVKFGLGYIHHTFKPEVQSSFVDQGNIGSNSQGERYDSRSNFDMKAHEAVAYIEDNFKLNSKINLNLGLHFSLFKTDKKSYTSLQPRLSSSYKVDDNFTIKASYSKMSQYTHLLSSYSISMPTDLWVPITDKIKPMQSHQYSIGGYYTGLKGWQFSVEAYYKTMKNVLEYKDGASFVGSSEDWESKVEMGKGKAMGIEFMAQKSLGKLTGSLSYTLSKSDRKFSVGGINDGKSFPYKYDRRHNINLTMSYKFSEKIDVFASWEYYTGGMTTIAEEQFLLLRPDGENRYGQSELGGYIEGRNNYRLPSNHRLNIGVNFHKKTKRGMQTWNISIYNIYNAMNPTFMYRDVKSDPEGNNQVILKKVTVLPFLPSVSYIYKF